MRIALAQIDPTVGDIDGNAARVLEAIGRRAGGRRRHHAAPGAGAHRLSARGPARPSDHFVEEQPRRARGGRRGVLAARRVVGFVDRDDGTPLQRGRPAAATAGWSASTTSAACPTTASSTRTLLRAGQRAPASSSCGGTMFDRHRVRGHVGARARAEDAADGARRSAQHLRVAVPRRARAPSARRCCAQRARDNGLWLAYCNLVGGQDELVFDGRSVVVAPDGEVVARGAAFDEDLLVADFAAGGPARRGRADRARARSARRRSTARSSLGLRDYLRQERLRRRGARAVRRHRLRADGGRSPPTRSGAEHVHGVLMPSPLLVGGQRRRTRTRSPTPRASRRSTLPIEGPFQALLETLAPSFDGRASPTSPRRTCRRACAARCSWRSRTSSAGSCWPRATRASCRSATRRCTATWSAASRRSRTCSRRASTSCALAQRDGEVAIPGVEHRRSRRRRSCARTSSTRTRCPPYEVLDADPARATSSRTTSRDEIVADGLRRRDGRPRVPHGRRRRVQAAPGSARHQDHAQGVRQGPPDAGHQPVPAARDRREARAPTGSRVGDRDHVGESAATRGRGRSRWLRGALSEPFGVCRPADDWCHATPAASTLVALSIDGGAARARRALLPSTRGTAVARCARWRSTRRLQGAGRRPSAHGRARSRGRADAGRRRASWLERARHRDRASTSGSATTSEGDVFVERADRHPAPARCARRAGRRRSEYRARCLARGTCASRTLMD